MTLTHSPEVTLTSRGESSTPVPSPEAVSVDPVEAALALAEAYRLRFEQLRNVFIKTQPMEVTLGYANLLTKPVVVETPKSNRPIDVADYVSLSSEVDHDLDFKLDTAFQKLLRERQPQPEPELVMTSRLHAIGEKAISATKRWFSSLQPLPTGDVSLDVAQHELVS